MLNLTKGSTQTIYFTGTELATISDPYFLFVFTNRITEEVVKFNITNTSTATDRYDKFSLVVDDQFEDATTGFWDYEIRQKATSVDVAVSGTIVETGYMYLSDTAEVVSEYSEQDNDFKTYDGS